MTILGIANDETASACIIRDGKLIAAASEERFTRVKMDNSWPAQSIEYCLEFAGTTLEELDAVTYGWSAGFDAERHLLPYFDRIVYEAEQNPGGLAVFRERIDTEIQQDRKKRDEFWEFIEVNNLQEKAYSYDHHESHAWSAYSCSPFEEALVVTCDGRGDFLALSVAWIDRDKMDVLYRASSVDSLGFFYGRITSLLGYTPHRHEGKVTGLAAHGDPEKLLPLMREMIYVKSGKIYGQSGEYYRPFYSNFSEKLEAVIAENSREDVAAAAQVHLEQCVTELVRYHVEQTGAEYVCMAGGTFANVRVNQCVYEIPGVKNIYIHPQMGDGGLSVGAAAGYLYERNEPKVEVEDMYLGPEYTDEEILAELKNQKELEWEIPDDREGRAVEALGENRVIGWFNGRMEFGPRALCNRSIIYHCKDRTVNDWLNERMDRTEFMPFAPVTAEELAPECYKGWKGDHIASRFMTVTYYCTEKMAESCPAAVHIDNTARPQVVSSSDNPAIHKLLMRFYKETGGLSLINTSFNRHEEPIVNQPSEAIDALRRGIVDVLFIGSYMVVKG
ncbi:MAG: carbamoyltransferase C-terminal domain-containing protein [Balneolaceae bacterium]